MTWLVDTLFVTGALIGLVLLIRGPVARHFGPALAYALWLLPLLRLIVPPLTVQTRPPLQYEPVLLMSAEAVAEPVAAPAFDPWPWLAAIWLAGAGLFLAWRLGGYALMRRRTLRGASLVERRGGIRIVETDAIAVPVAFGVIDKVVALPRGFAASCDARSRDLAIAHELEHHAGRDIAVNFAMQPLLALHWFNPLAWAGWRALRRDQEAACDARVLAGRDAATRAAYARLIAAFAKGRNLSLATPMACAVVTEKSIVYRLRSLTMTEPTASRRMAGRLLIAAGVIALPLTASISYATAENVPAAPVPAASSAPAEKPVVHKEHRIVIVQKDGKDDAKLKTKVIEKDGKTIVFKTDKDLSEAEVEAHVAKAMSAMPIPPEPPVPPVPPVPGEKRRVMIMSDGGDAHGKHRVMLLDGEPLGGSCTNEAVQSQAQASEAGTDGKTKTVRIRLCSIGHHMAKAVEGIRAARDRIAKDSEMSATMRDTIVKQLDAEIAKLSKQG
ncbi:beta-lactamase regulating signal transducer with metallopeptidase domain [Novosphingobium kunmingense]|uniref:Beta-lactamase regulating signal transducer with metallopeptidase domain n=1 Tax=Novosphingobium kunmingense TaxID=1211806 RepID=A0A2N0I3L0_9SPHN|nr:M56 family metallopeptidase [Novosphingobium kunmingense]PKB25745.1 beta-lactamase regulating signal transducer with metallopeptidase domain [Novosphingobium kunmingense]